MAVDDLSRRVLYVGDGSTTEFAFNFVVFVTTDVAVYTQDEEGEDQLISPSNYTVTLNENQDTNPGGVVVFNSAPADEEVIAVVSAVPETQPMVLTTYDGFDPEVLNKSADRAVSLIQQLSDDVSRSIRLPRTSQKTATAAYAELVESAEKANEALALMGETINAAEEVQRALDEAGDVAGAVPVAATGSSETQALSDWCADIVSARGGTSAVTAEGSTTARSLALRLSEVINVKDYGAVGDDSTDDTAALQAAFNAAAASGADVFFPTGVYRISAQVQFGGDLRVFCYGATIKASDTDNYSMLANTLGYDIETGPAGYTGNSNICWFGGVIDGNCQDSEASVLRQALVFHHAHNIRVEGTVFKNCRRVHTLEFGGCKDVVVTNCRFYGQYPPQISDYYPEVIQLNPNTEAATPTVYADGTENKGILIEGCLVTNAENTSEITDSSPYAGIGSHGNAPDRRTEDVVIRNCTFRGIRHRAATCSNTMFYNWKVLDCTFDGVGDAGIHITHRSDGTVPVGNFEIRGNTFVNTKTAVYQSGFANSYQEDIIVRENVAEVTNQFVNLHYAKNVVVENNAATVDAEGRSGATMACYFYGIDSPKFKNFVLTTKNTEQISSLYAATISTGCRNVLFSGISSDKTQPPVNQLAATVDGIHGDDAGLHVFRAKQSTATQDNVFSSAPAIALVSDYPYGAPQIGYQADKAFWIGAYQDNSEGRSVLLRRALLLYGENETYPYAFCPAVTETQNLGTPANKWKEIFSAAGSINTSDERLKTSITDPDDALMRAWGKVGFKVFQFRDAVEKKGEAARLHVGVVAQQVRDAFASEGLDANRYGLFCYDEWEDEYADVEVEDSPAVVAEDGTELEPAKTHLERTLVRAAGNGYGIRYSEALALECAYQRWRLEKLEEKLR